MMTQLKRDKSIDVAKGLGMVMVVFGHTQSEFTQIVYQFHLPLFFFLSGMVFNEKKLGNFPVFVLNKFKNLWVPFVKYEIAFLLLHNFFSSIDLYTTVSNYTLYYTFVDIAKKAGLILTMGYGEKLAGPLWFLISSLEIVILFGFINFCFIKLNFKKNTKSLLIAFIAIICFTIGCFTHLPRMGSQSLIGLLFFAAGFIYKDVKEKIPYKWWIALISAGIIYASYKYNFVDISMLKITYKPLLVLSGISGCYFTLYLAKHLPNIMANILEYCGKNTIPVLSLHCISFKVILFIEIVVYGLDKSYLGYFPTYDVNEFWSILFTIFGVLLPLLLIWGLERIKMRFRTFLP